MVVLVVGILLVPNNAEYMEADVKPAILLQRGYFDEDKISIESLV
jgi:hypothetical protein